MFILLLICWIVFNQNLTWEIFLFGLVISAALYAFMCSFMDYSIKKDLFIMKRLPGIALYVILLVWEVIKANFVLFGIVFRKKKHAPVIVEFRTKLKTRTARAFLANSITLTPGTITIGVEGDLFRIHCFDKSLAEDIDATVFEKRLLKLEEGAVQ
jgi:multicomponent Na+:H+ antiporter subunit E